MMNFYLPLLLVFSFIAGTVARATSVDEIVRFESMIPEDMHNKRFWIDFAETTSYNFVNLGTMIGIGYRFDYLGIDTRFAFGKTTYASLNASPDDINIFYYVDPSAELFRPRNHHDTWSYFMVEPGFSVSARILPRTLRRFSQRARVGFGIGRYHDHGYGTDFTAWLFSTEGTLFYQLGEQSAWSLGLSVDWHSGVLVLVHAESSVENRRLPVSWVGGSLGVRYSF